MVRRVTTYYCEVCGTAYGDENLAHACETSPAAPLQPGDVILRSARASDEFTPERDALVWGIVESVETTAGRPDAPWHTHSFYTSGLRDVITATQIVRPFAGNIAFERDLLMGPRHTREIKDLMDTYPEVRNQLAESFGILSSRQGSSALTPEMYVQWDDLRYTAYDFGFIQGDEPVTLPTRMVSLLQWAADPIPVVDVHQSLFYKPRLGLHGGDRVYRPFDDNVGLRTKWLIAEGDPYRYLRFHIQTYGEQLLELESIQRQIYTGTERWFDRLEDLFRPKQDPGQVPPDIKAWAVERHLDGSPEEIAVAVYAYLVEQQRGWKTEMREVPPIIPQGIPVIAVASGKGGVGKSTLSANVARVLAAMGKKPLYLDLDFYGPSAPTEFDVHEPLIVKQGYLQPHVKDGVQIVSMGNLISADTALHWRGPVLEAFIFLLTAHIDYAGIDIIVVDTPPGTGDVQMGLSKRLFPDGILMVTTGSELALADVRRSIHAYRDSSIPIIGLVENMSEMRLNDAGDYRRLFGSRARLPEFCKEENVEFLGRVPFVDDTGQLLQQIEGIVTAMYQRRPEILGPASGDS